MFHVEQSSNLEPSTSNLAMFHVEHRPLFVAQHTEVFHTTTTKSPLDSPPFPIVHSFLHRTAAFCTPPAIASTALRPIGFSHTSCPPCPHKQTRLPHLPMQPRPRSSPSSIRRAASARPRRPSTSPPRSRSKACQRC